MTATMFLIGLIYVAFVGLLIALGVNVVLIVVIAGGMLLAQYWFSDRLALAAMGAHVTRPQDAPELHAMVERLCIQANLPKPRIAVAQTDMPNAFATGRSPKNATVCATTGIMNALEPSELEGVMAHELTHVANRDVLVMTIAAFLATLAGLMTRFMFFGGFGGNRNNGNSTAIFFLVFVASILVYVIGFLLIRLLSRYREYAADRGAAVITGNPSALSAALLKLEGAMDRVPQKDLREAQPMNAFFIIPAHVKRSAMELFSTHPPMAKRIEKLQAMERELQSSGATL